MIRRIFPAAVLALWLFITGLQAGTPSRYHYFAIVGDGGGFRTTFLVLNQGQESVSATIRFFEADGSPWAVSVDDVAASVFLAEVPSRGMLRLQTDDAAELPKGGWATLEASREVGAQVFFEIFSNENLVTQAAVESPGPMRSADLFVVHGPPTQTGIAVVNLAEPGPDRPVRVELTLRNHTGTDVAVTQFTLQAGESVSRYIGQFFPQVTRIVGVLSVRASGPVSIVTLQQTGLVLGTLPAVRYTF